VNSNPVVKPNTKVDSDLPRVEISDGLAKETEGPVPLRGLLTRPVVVSIANYGMIALLDMTNGTLIPLIWSTSVEFGGLSMSPASIGLCLGGYGFVNCIFQLVAFPHIVKRLGPRRVFIASVILFFPVYTMFPFENLALRHSGRGLNPAAPLIMLQLSAMTFSAMGFSKFCLAPYFVHSMVTEVVWIDQARYLCIYPLLHLTSGHSALRMESRRRLSRFSARSHRLLPRRCLHSH
jgi:hypothetical protein